MSEPKALEVRPQPSAGMPPMAIVPKDLNEVARIASMIAASGLAPRGMEKPEAVAVAVMMGLEVGLSPMQAIQNIAVINGRASVWGDAALALVRSSGLLESFKEEPILENGAVAGYRCTAKRKGEPNICVREFTLKDAKRAGLLNKRGPWQEYQPRMLQMRARSWTLRDLFPDVLRGLSVREEAMDMEPIVAAPVPIKTTVHDVAPAEDKEPDPLLVEAAPDDAAEAVAASEAPDAPDCALKEAEGLDSIPAATDAMVEAPQRGPDIRTMAIEEIMAALEDESTADAVNRAIEKFCKIAVVEPLTWDASLGSGQIQKLLSQVRDIVAAKD